MNENIYTLNTTKILFPKNGEIVSVPEFIYYNNLVNNIKENLSDYGGFGTQYLRICKELIRNYERKRFKEYAENI